MARAESQQSGITNAAATYHKTPPKGGGSTPANSDTARRIGGRFASPKQVTPEDASRITHQPATSYTKTVDAGDTSYQTTSQKFSADKYSGGIPVNPVGQASDPTARRVNNIRNPAVTYTRPPSAANVNHPPRTTNAKVTSTPASQSNYNTGLRPSPQPRARRKKRGLRRVVCTAYKAAARVSLVMLYTWVGFLWIPQAVFAVLFWIALGTQVTIEEFIKQDGIMGSIIELGLKYSGLEWAFDVLFWLAFAANVFFAILQTLSVLVYTKFLGMHPLGGRGFALKTPVACFALIFSIAGIGFLPLFWLWVATISLYPR